MSKQEVYDRDGGKCFFCGVELTLDEATHEHLLVTTHGGSNSNKNTTIACQPCNLEAGAKSIVEKVKLRDQKRGLAKDKVTTLTVGDIKIEIREAKT